MHSQLSISDSDLWCSERTGFTMQSTGILGLLNNSRMLNILDKRSHFSDSTTGFQDHHTAGRHIQNLRRAELSYIHLYPADKNWFILDSAFTKSSLKTQMKICDPVLLFRKLLLNEIIIIKKKTNLSYAKPWFKTTQGKSAQESSHESFKTGFAFSHKFLPLQNTRTIIADLGKNRICWGRYRLSYLWKSGQTPLTPAWQRVEICWPTVRCCTLLCIHPAAIVLQLSRAAVW